VKNTSRIHKKKSILAGRRVCPAHLPGLVSVALTCSHFVIVCTLPQLFSFLIMPVRARLPSIMSSILVMSPKKNYFFGSFFDQGLRQILLHNRALEYRGKIFVNDFVTVGKKF